MRDPLNKTMSERTNAVGFLIDRREYRLLNVFHGCYDFYIIKDMENGSMGMTTDDMCFILNKMPIFKRFK